MVEFKPQDPKFFTFMSTDGEGFNSFFHCLIFYDEVHESDVLTDDDLATLKKDIMKNEHSSRSPNKQTTTRRTNGGLSEEEETEEMPNIIRKKMKNRNK